MEKASSGFWYRGDQDIKGKTMMLQEKRGARERFMLVLRDSSQRTSEYISFFYKIHYNVKFVILTILKCAIQWP